MELVFMEILGGDGGTQPGSLSAAQPFVPKNIAFL
jgi:hypothetical protein